MIQGVPPVPNAAAGLRSTLVMMLAIVILLLAVWEALTPTAALP
jgi:hypothetical protein